MPIRLSPVDITYEDMDRADAENHPGLLPEVTRVARRFFCDAYAATPFLWDYKQWGQDSPTSLPTAMFDRMCRPLGVLPGNRTAPFTGGQCPNVLYEVRLTHTETAVLNDQFRTENVVTSNTFYGPIRKVYMFGGIFLKAGGVVLKTYKGFKVECNESDGQGGFRPTTLILKQFSDENLRGINDLGQITVTRIGGVDNCGDPEPQYPQTPPNINNFNNTVNLTIAPNVVVNAPITIVPTLIAPVGVVVRPEVNVKVGDIVVTFSPGGATYSTPDPLPPGVDIKEDPREFPPDVINNDNSIDLGGSDVDLTPIVQKLNQIEDELHKCCNRNYPYPFPEGATVTSLGNGNSGTVDLPEKCFAVKLQITSDLNKMDVQSGDDGVSVYQAGWVNFLNGEIPMPREPIAASSNYYMVPERFSGSFAWKMRKDYTCNVSCYTSTKDN